VLMMALVGSVLSAALAAFVVIARWLGVSPALYGPWKKLHHCRTKVGYSMLAVCRGLQEFGSHRLDGNFCPPFSATS
jgi:hypothetical protein